MQAVATSTQGLVNLNLIPILDYSLSSYILVQTSLYMLEISFDLNTKCIMLLSHIVLCSFPGVSTGKCKLSIILSKPFIRRFFHCLGNHKV